MEALQFSSVNRVPCTLSCTGNRRIKAAFSSAFTGGTINSASLSSSRNLSTREIWSWVKSKTVVGHGRYRRSQVRAEMFGQLTGGLEAAWSKLKGEEVLTKDNIAEPMRDIRRALLEADVSLPVVRRFVQSVSDQAVGMGVIRGVKPDQQLVKIVHDELVKLMGGEVSELQFAKSGPTVILLAGLQGVGKTTVCAKLACYLKKQGKSCMLIAGDVYRPAAIDQLVILGEQVGVPVYTAGTDVKPADIAKQGLKEAKKNNVDVVIMDTAGRLQIDKGMMDELKDVKKFLNPTEVLLVVDAMTGQEAAALVTTFNVEIGITGAILTKLDGDSRGGAALSVKEVSGKPIKLVGRGERMEDLEPFYPDRMAGRILGMGDVLSFVEKATEVMRQEDAEDLHRATPQGNKSCLGSTPDLVFRKLGAATVHCAACLLRCKELACTSFEALSDRCQLVCSTMGRPIPVQCAHSKCDAVRTVDTEGLTFSAQCCFEKRASSLSANQLWACCFEHKKSVLVDIMRDMPYTHLPQLKPQEAAALIS